MILGIDATNIRSGGGLTHLKEVLQYAEPKDYLFEKVIVWSNEKTLSKLPDYDWLHKKTHNLLNQSFIFSFLFQFLLLSKKAMKENCDILFVPGGTFLGNFPRIVSMSQNMLPFEKEESARFTDLKSRLRFKLLHFTQKNTFRKSKGIIFLTRYAKSYITNSASLRGNSVIIPHGINPDFLNEPKQQKEVSKYSIERPFKLLYVSIVTVYKHQWIVADAVLRLRREGYPVALDLVGGNTEESLLKLQEVLKKDVQKCIQYKGEVNYEMLAEIYKKAEGFVFASSCENMPIILIEAMTAGLPIACSNMGPMPEILGEDGFYFNPLNAHDVYLSLKEMLDFAEKRKFKSHNSYNKSINYTWKDCSHQTFDYLSQIAKTTNLCK
ncbi:hypothetical protein CBW16_08425 [Flavobacteriaceae bacterium JJC]|nr:hypothetical protein CBW16_08425 [Flavobacteriaceae bacterium JJC]